MNCPTEYAEQCKIFEWSRLMVATNQEPRLRLLRAGMEGVRLSIGTRVKAKRAGMDSSWPDLFLAVPVRKECCEGWLLEHTCGLFIELKRLKGSTASPGQKAMHELLRAQGYRVDVCNGADVAIKCIKDYLGMEG